MAMEILVTCRVHLATRSSRMPGRSGEHRQLGPGLDRGHPFQVEAERSAGSCANLLGKWRFLRGIVRQFSRSRGTWPSGSASHHRAPRGTKTLRFGCVHVGSCAPGLCRTRDIAPAPGVGPSWRSCAIAKSEDTAFRAATRVRVTLPMLNANRCRRVGSRERNSFVGGDHVVSAVA